MFQTINLAPHLDELAEKKWTLLSLDLATVPELSQLKALAENPLRRKKDYRPAQLAAIQQVESKVRNDQIIWLEAKDPELHAAERSLLRGLDQMAFEIKNELRVSVSNIECHYAYYEKDHFYQKHRDTTARNNQRLFSFVLYLNPDWGPDDGGELVGYEEDLVLFKIRPAMGHMMIFQSQLEHEVRPTRKDRFSVTGWFRK